MRILRKPSECLAVSWPRAGRLGTEGGSGLRWWLVEHLRRGERRGEGRQQSVAAVVRRVAVC